MNSSAALKSPTTERITKSRSVVLAGLGVCLVALLISQRETAISLYELWIDSNEYGHGVLILPLVIYLLWDRREQFPQEVIRPSFLGVLLTIGLVLIWVMSNLLGVLIGEQLALVMLLLTMIVGVAGWNLMRACALPILLLMLAVPVWSYINPILQSTTASASTIMTRLAGVPVFNEGLYMTIPEGRFLVAEVCSGLRYLLAGLTLAFLFALLNLYSTRYRLFLFFSTLVLSVVFNWIRVTIIVASGHYLGMETSLVQKHIWLGWVLFIVVAAIVMWIGNALIDREVKNAPIKPTIRPKAEMNTQQSLWSGINAFTCVVALCVGSALTTTDSNANIETSTSLNLRGLSIPGYRPESNNQDFSWQPMFQNSDAWSQITFSGTSEPISLYVAYYHQQRQDAEIVNESNHLYDHQIWERTSVKARPESVPVSEQLSVEEFEIIKQNGREQRLVWRIYWVGNEFTGNGIDAKIGQIKSLFTGNSSAAGIVLSVPRNTNLERSRELLHNFVKTSLEPLNNYLASLNR